MKYLADKDVASGLMFLVIGLAGLGLSFGYEFGQPSHPGPGFFPVLLSALLALIGLAIIATGLLRPLERFPTIVWRPLLLITCAVLVFALRIDRFGLMPTVFIASLVATFAKADFGVVPRLLTAVSLAAFTALLFIALLRMPIPLWAF